MVASNRSRTCKEEAVSEDIRSTRFVLFTAPVNDLYFTTALTTLVQNTAYPEAIWWGWYHDEILVLTFTFEAASNMNDVLRKLLFIEQITKTFEEHKNTQVFSSLAVHPHPLPKGTISYMKEIVP